MLTLKKLSLKNYCNYEDYTFNFLKPDGSPYKFICFYGPNGTGKTTALEAISKLTMNVTGRSLPMICESLRKYVRSTDYNPAYDSLKGFVYKNDKIDGEREQQLSEMMIEGTYVMNGKEFVVQLSQDGYARNDFAPLKQPDSGPWGSEHLKYRQRIAHFITSDSDLSMSKFQLHVSQKENFERIVSEVMRFPAECIAPSGTNIYDRDYCTDFVIKKKDFNIHYKRMSAGERKICKSFSQILNVIHDLEHPAPKEKAMPGWPRLLLLDNVEMHVYYDRHVTLIECLKKIFQKQQIFSATHSGILIQRHLAGENDTENELYIDLEQINY